MHLHHASDRPSTHATPPVLILVLALLLALVLAACSSDGDEASDPDGSSDDSTPAAPAAPAPDEDRPAFEAARGRLVPYYAWDNRAPGEMMVWLRAQS